MPCIKKNPGVRSGAGDIGAVLRLVTGGRPSFTVCGCFSSGGKYNLGKIGGS